MKMKMGWRRKTTWKKKLMDIYVVIIWNAKHAIENCNIASRQAANRPASQPTRYPASQSLILWMCEKNGQAFQRPASQPSIHLCHIFIQIATTWNVALMAQHVAHVVLQTNSGPLMRSNGHATTTAAAISSRKSNSKQNSKKHDQWQ